VTLVAAQHFEYYIIATLFTATEGEAIGILKSFAWEEENHSNKFLDSFIANETYVSLKETKDG
jgi:hypothetical protein